MIFTQGSKESIEAHKDILERFIKEDEEQHKAELAKLHDKQAEPYVKELEDIIARKHQYGFYAQADIKRAGELLPLLEKIENGEYEETEEGMEKSMQDSVNRILERQQGITNPLNKEGFA